MVEKQMFVNPQLKARNGLLNCIAIEFRQLSIGYGSQLNGLLPKSIICERRSCAPFTQSTLTRFDFWIWRGQYKLFSQHLFSTLIKQIERTFDVKSSS